MGKLNQIDKAADSKGSAVTTIWQFVKFIFVSLLAMIVQFALLNILPLIPAIKAQYDTPFAWWVFVSTVAAGGLGYFIVNNTANIIAQIVAFFVNREKTFNSSANIAVTLPIYIVFTIALICFSAWLNPTLKDLFVSKGWMEDALASNASTMICSAVQFFLYFPVDKILFHKKKEEAVEEAADVIPAAEEIAQEVTEKAEAVEETAEAVAEEVEEEAEAVAQTAEETIDAVAQTVTEETEAAAQAVEDAADDITE